MNWFHRRKPQYEWPARGWVHGFIEMEDGSIKTDVVYCVICLTDGACTPYFSGTEGASRRMEHMASHGA